MTSPSDHSASAYELFHAMIKVEKGKEKGSKDHRTKLCAQFKQTLSHEHFQVHFVGVWWVISLCLCTLCRLT